MSSADIKRLQIPWLKENRIKKVEVVGRTLTNLYKEHGKDGVDLLKIDVEGAEMDILESGEEILEGFNKIVIEYHNNTLKENIQKFLSLKGFNIVYNSINKDTLNKGEFGDVYFVRGN